LTSKYVFEALSNIENNGLNVWALGLESISRRKYTGLMW